MPRTTSFRKDFMANNKPQKFKETERFSIRRLAFWLSAAGTVYFIGVWDVVGMAISGAVFVLTLISKLFSMAKETDDSDDQN
jgi:hypothetical protein